MVNLTVFMVLSTAIHYLFGRAEITRFLWIRYPPFLDRLARCAACSGFWIGLGLSQLVQPPFVEQVRWNYWLAPFVGALYGLFLTPIGTWILVTTLDLSAIKDDITDNHPPKSDDGQGQTAQ
jgi:hypothetical protein